MPDPVKRYVLVLGEEARRDLVSGIDVLPAQLLAEDALTEDEAVERMVPKMMRAFYAERDRHECDAHATALDTWNVVAASALAALNPENRKEEAA